MIERIWVILELFSTKYIWYLPRKDYFPFYAGKKIKNKKQFTLFYEVGHQLYYKEIEEEKC